MAESITGSIIWFLLFFVFAFFYPRIMLSQMIWKLEDATNKMEEMSHKTKIMIFKKTKKKDKNIFKKINNFMDLVVIQPSNLDPFGIVKKIDNIIRASDKRFDEFSHEIGKGLNESEIKKINYGLRGGMSVHQIAKIMRHYVELVKKYKNLQIAMVVQMQLPMIQSIIKSEFEGTKAFLYGLPVGDSIGPLSAAYHMENPKEIEGHMAYDIKKIEGRKVIFIKASGPEPELGRLDDTLKKLFRNHKINRVLTIDAGAKLEGEKTGSVSEGVGFAMGGIAEREILENMIMKRNIPIDSIIVKMSTEEAIKPMKTDIFKSLKEINNYILESIRRTKKGGTIVIVGVGNTIGVGNKKTVVQAVEKVVKKLNKKKVKKKKRFF